MELTAAVPAEPRDPYASDVPARVPLDVDLEDKLVFGLTPIRLGYMVVALLASFSLWSSPWAPAAIRLLVAAAVALVGAGAAWGRWRGRPADAWLLDAALYSMSNTRLEWKVGLRRRRHVKTGAREP